MEINKEKILVVKNLTVKYGFKQKSIIKNFNLEIDSGDHLAIIGPSGCGKTTFAKTLVIYCLKRPLLKGIYRFLM